MEIKASEVSALFCAVDKWDWMKYGKWLKIKEGDSELEYTFSNVDYYQEDITHLIKPLVGYKVKIKQIGEHHNDGQLVDYILTIKSPNGTKTKLETRMCLMIGFEYNQDVVLK